MDIIGEIAKIVGPENLHDDPVECLCYSRDMSVHQGIPDAVIFPKSTEQISAIMKLACREKIPVTPRGSGTSVTGAVLPVKGGLLLDLHLMNHILEINKSDFYARVEPGVARHQKPGAPADSEPEGPDPGHPHTRLRLRHGRAGDAGRLLDDVDAPARREKRPRENR